MGFVKSSDELLRAWPETIEFYDAEMLFVVWETDPQAITRLLPPPLTPGKRPLATAFIASYPRTNFGVTYREAALALPATHGGVEAPYFLAMPVTDDMAMVLGREVFGFPKKIANIEWVHEGQEIRGRVERHGIRFFEVRAELNGQFNAPDAQEAFAEPFTFAEGVAVLPAYNFKYFPAPEGKGFDYAPRLVRQRNEFRPASFAGGRGEVTVRSSAQDPWGDVPVVRVLGAMYYQGNTTMLSGEAVAETDAEAFAPYAFIKYDF